MRAFVGTSGYSYAPWKGSFYPKKLKNAEMLRYYARFLTTVEINNTFYRMPKTEVVAAWAAQTPDNFRFVLKASQRITHRERMKEAPSESVEFLLKVSSALGDKRGPLLFQFPPNLKVDPPRLEAFVAHLPSDVQAAFEFRNETWFNDDTWKILGDKGIALVMSESEKLTAPLVATTDWGYLRLREEDYDDSDLDAWTERILSQPWSDVYVFFKHEDEGKAPDLANRLIERLKSAGVEAGGGGAPVPGDVEEPAS